MNVINTAEATSRIAGIHELVRNTLTILGDELLRGDAARVASAWTRMVKEENDLLDSEAAYDLRERVSREIGVDRSEAGCEDNWVYGTFVELRLAYGHEWAVDALADYLRIFEGSPDADVLAQGVWERALKQYLKVIQGECETA
ncbi:MAG: hypothetical protein Q7U80_04520 [Thiobacillus sp.]|nr:hypothetical protein [Thiobacillus sp.]MDP3125602.1 hypothetical protein [Thiobacillus sp.]